MNKTRLRSYARLIARKGANVQKGQTVLLYADLDQPEFVKMLVEECYKAGAARVQLEWQFEPLEKLHARYQSEETLGETRDWEKARLQHMVDTLPARIYLESADPDVLILSFKKLSGTTPTALSTAKYQTLQSRLKHRLNAATKYKQ